MFLLSSITQPYVNTSTAPPTATWRNAYALWCARLPHHVLSAVVVPTRGTVMLAGLAHAGCPWIAALCAWPTPPWSPAFNVVLEYQAHPHPRARHYYLQMIFLVIYENSFLFILRSVLAVLSATRRHRRKHSRPGPRR